MSWSMRFPQEQSWGGQRRNAPCPPCFTPNISGGHASLCPPYDISLSAGIGIGSLHRRIEFARIGALLAGAVARALPAAERYVIVDAGGRQIDHHHAGLAVALVVRGVFQAGGADAGGETELGVVGDRQRLVVVLGADDRGDRSKNLLTRDAHIVVGLGEQRRLEVMAGRLALEQLAAPGELGAFVLADLDITQILV